jgi:hypothetical protein
MKRSILHSIVFSLIFSLMSFTATAGDFDWLKDFNIQAQLDPEGFKARLAARFRIGAADVTTVISNVREPADAYMVLRLGEMTSRPTPEVIEQYNATKGQGWGVVAKNLGINPGSKEFHALKRGADMELNGTQNQNGPGKSKHKNNEKTKGSDLTKSSDKTKGSNKAKENDKDESDIKDKGKNTKQIHD